MDEYNKKVKDSRQGRDLDKKEANKLKKFGKDIESNRGLITNLHNQMMNNIRDLYPYTQNKDYEKLKRQAIPINKKISELKDKKYSLVNTSMIITSSKADGTWQEQEARENARIKKEKEDTAPERARLEKEISDLENSPVLLKLAEMEDRSEANNFVSKVIQKFNNNKPIEDELKPLPQLKGSGLIKNIYNTVKSLNKDEKQTIKNVVQSIVSGKGKNKKNINDGYALHAVIINKSVPLEKAKKDARNIMKSKTDKFMRQTENSYRFRNIPKSKFSDFRSQVINPEITLIWGKMK